MTWNVGPAIRVRHQFRKVNQIAACMVASLHVSQIAKIAPKTATKSQRSGRSIPIAKNLIPSLAKTARWPHASTSLGKMTGPGIRKWQLNIPIRLDRQLRMNASGSTLIRRQTAALAGASPPSRPAYARSVSAGVSRFASKLILFAHQSPHLLTALRRQVVCQHDVLWTRCLSSNGNYRSSAEQSLC